LKPNIILIGPAQTGKSTVAKLLGQRLDMPVFDFDDQRWQYYEEIGYDKVKAQKIREEQGLAALAQYWKPFDIYTVERVLGAFPEGYVMAFGAVHSFYDDDALFARAKQALAPFENIVLLLPSPDVEESIEILRHRLIIKRPDLNADEVMALDRLFIEHHSNYDLAKMIVYNKDKTPHETCDEIIGKL
jgi:hypothetical protein